MLEQKAFERVISILRFPLIVGVVLIHTSVKCDAGEAPIYSALHKLFSNLLVSPCVPTFFFISGFLFFYKVQNFTKDIYKTKLKKRVQTLLIPYLFWNIVVLLYYTAGHICFPGIIAPDNCNVLQYSFVDLIRSFWDNPDGFPICYQLWYLRNLIVLCICSPIIYVLLKRMSKYSIYLFLLIYLCFDVSGMLKSAFWFMCGSYFSLWNINVVKVFAKIKWLVIAVFLCLLTICFFDNSVGWLRDSMVLCGIASFICLANEYVIHYEHKPNVFDKSTFFIYGFHGFPIVLLATTILPRFLGSADAMCVIQYLLAPISIILLSVALYMLLHKFFPSFLKVINGGR